MVPDRFRITRVLMMGTPLLVLAAIVMQFTGVYRAAPSSDLTHLQNLLVGRPYHVPGVPPPLVVGLFVPLLLLCAAVPALRRRWDVARGELIVVFCMLFLGVPVLGSAFWHQFPGAQLEYLRVRQMDAKMRRLSQAMAISPDLWPNQGNLLDGASVEDVLDGASVEDAERRGIHWTVRPEATASFVDSPDGPGRCVRIRHRSPQDTSEITVELVRGETARFLKPQFRYAVCAQLRLDDPGPRTQASLQAGTHSGRLSTIATLGDRTKPALLAPDRFLTTGQTDYSVPRDLGDRFYIRVLFSGTGTLYARNLTLIDTEDVYRYYEGYEEASPQTYDSLPQHDRAAVRLRPDGTRASWIHALLGRVPWRSWARPLTAWALLVLGMFLAMFCMVTIFYRQWEESDRLTFPLQTYLQDLTRGDEHGRLQILRSTPFWIGLGACVLHLSLQRLNTYFPEIPAVGTSVSIPELLPPGLIREGLESAPDAMFFDIRPAFVAVAFLISLEMSSSLLVFFALGLLYRVGGRYTPLRSISLGAYGSGGFPFTGLQLIGAVLFMGCFFVFAARQQLARVVKKVLGRPNAPDDSAEAMSYRAATAGLVVSVVLILCFAHIAQVSPVFMLGYMLVILLFSLATARIRAETGLPHLVILPVQPLTLMFLFGGAMVLGFREMVLPAQASFIHVGAFLLLASVLTESMAAATRAGVPLRKLSTCLWAAFGIALVVGGIIFLSWAYTVGSANMHATVTQAWHQHESTMNGFDSNDQQITEYFDDHPDERPILTRQKRHELAPIVSGSWVVVAVSFAIAGLLTLARTIWLGFPLHPLGYALAFTPAMGVLWPSLALGHVVKRLGLRFGGVQLSRQVLRPFFVGLFVGDLCTVALWQVLEGLVFAAV